MEIYGYTVATLGVITGLVYGLVEMAKNLWLNKHEEYKKYIPILAGLLGTIIGLVVYLFAPEILPTPTWYGALLTGLASGLAAVGINQIPKQLGKGVEDDNARGL